MRGRGKACYDKEVMKEKNALRKTHIIRLDATDVESFCDVTAKFGFPVSLASTADRKKTVNAASIPDVLSLDLGRNGTLTVE